jgi:hypothetical protein
VAHQRENAPRGTQRPRHGPDSAVGREVGVGEVPARRPDATGAPADQRPHSASATSSSPRRPPHPAPHRSPTHRLPVRSTTLGPAAAQPARSPHRVRPVRQGASRGRPWAHVHQRDQGARGQPLGQPLRHMAARTRGRAPPHTKHMGTRSPPAAAATGLRSPGGPPRMWSRGVHLAGRRRRVEGAATCRGTPRRLRRRSAPGDRMPLAKASSGIIAAAARLRARRRAAAAGVGGAVQVG